MMPDAEYVGKWVRFYVDGKLVIGEVKYVDRDRQNDFYLLTDAGRVRYDYVLEMR